MLTPQFILPIAGEIVVDLFAGGGGASTGIEQAVGRHVDVSVNHDHDADAMIAEAIAHLSGVRLLVLDRFDVLDLKGREDLIAWLDILAQDGEIDTALIFGTLKALPAETADMATFWIEDGVCAPAGQMKAAA